VVLLSGALGLRVAGGAPWLPLIFEASGK